MQDRKRSSEGESAQPEAKDPDKAQSWKDRHGPTVVALVAAAMLIALIVFQKYCRGE